MYLLSNYYYTRNIPCGFKKFVNRMFRIEIIVDKFYKGNFVKRILPYKNELANIFLDKNAEY